MYLGKTVAVVVPAYNEEAQILKVIETMPAFVDRIVVVNDGSDDRTAEVVKAYIETGCKSGVIIERKIISYSDSVYDRAEKLFAEMRAAEDCLYAKHTIYNDNNFDRVVLINQENSKVGRAVAVGYKWCREHAIDCAVVMDGDGQMDPSELESIVSPVIKEGIDYVKGNRLSHKAAAAVIPNTRYLGNSVLSLLTKIASGYWGVSDTQTGYVAISLRALEQIALHKIYYSYGYPNDLLVKLNIANCTIKEVPIKPVYDIGEESKMKIRRVIPRISWLLLKGFFTRIWIKYFIKSFHPIFLFYMGGLLLGLLNTPFFCQIVQYVVIQGKAIPTGTYMAFLLFTLFSFQSIGFAMWMDMQDNIRLQR